MSILDSLLLKSRVYDLLQKTVPSLELNDQTIVLTENGGHIESEETIKTFIETHEGVVSP